MKYFIYTITNIDKPEYFYIGSTNNFSRRKSHHKKNVNNKVGRLYWSFLYHYIRKNGGWEKFKMEVIHEGEIETLRQIKEVEQKYINEREPVLNSSNPHKGIDSIDINNGRNQDS